MIREAILKGYTREPRARETSLWVGDVGYCPRKAMLRVKGFESQPPEPTAVEYMQAGIYLEDDTIEALRNVWGDAIEAQRVIKNDIWSGKIDALIHLAPRPIILEHKAIGGKWFDYKQNLPKPQHCAQVLMYQYLLQELEGVRADPILYYRAWSNWAELFIEDRTTYVMAEGRINGERVSRRVEINVRALKRQLEDAFKLKVLPERLRKKEDGCTFKGKPSCGFYSLCWGSAAVDVSI